MAKKKKSIGYHGLGPSKPYDQDKVMEDWINTEVRHEKAILQAQEEAIKMGSDFKAAKATEQIEVERRRRERLFAKYPVLKKKFEEAMKDAKVN